MDISNYYKGSYKTCPRCKGHKYILGQKEYRENNSGLPNYKHIQSGRCFLCDAKGLAFYTDEGRVLKLGESKYGKMCVLEFNSSNGKMLRVLDIDLKSECSVSLVTNSVDEDILFPEGYELAWGDWSKVADAIFEEYSNARPVSITSFIDDEGKFCVNFIFYYGLNGKPIPPFYIQPPYDQEDSYKAVALLPKDYLLAVSGTYNESSDSMSLGVKTSTAFKVFEVDNIKANQKEYGSLNSLAEIEVKEMMNNEKCISIVSSIVLNEINRFNDGVSKSFVKVF